MQAKSTLSQKKSNVIVMAEVITQRDLEELAELKNALKAADRRFDEKRESIASRLRKGSRVEAGCHSIAFGQVPSERLMLDGDICL